MSLRGEEWLTKKTKTTDSSLSKKCVYPLGCNVRGVLFSRKFGLLHAE